MSNSTALITELSILVGILLLGLLAKLFPKKTGITRSSEHTSLDGGAGRDQRSGIRGQGSH